MQRQAEAQKQAKTLFDLASANWVASLEVLGSANEVMHRVKAILNKIQSSFRMQGQEIYALIVCNWSSPSLITSHAQKSQASVMGALVNDANSSGRTLGCVLEPCHTYSKGQLWKQEELMHKLLINSRCNIDGRFVLPFVERPDDRDQRPGDRDYNCLSVLSIVFSQIYLTYELGHMRVFAAHAGRCVAMGGWFFLLRMMMLTIGLGSNGGSARSCPRGCSMRRLR